MAAVRLPRLNVIAARSVAERAFLEAGGRNVSRSDARRAPSTSPAGLEFDPILPILALPAGALRSVNPLARARASAWSVVAKRGGKGVALIELRPTGAKLQADRLVFGGAAREVVRAMAIATRSGIRGRLGRLVCQEIGLDALWIHGTRRHSLVLMPPTPMGLPSFRLLDAGEVFARLRKTDAVRHHAVDPAPPPGTHRATAAEPTRGPHKRILLHPPPRPSLLG